MIAEPNGGISTITAVRTEGHPQGIAVYNFRVQDAHTYFVRADGSQAEPVWVHNASRITPESNKRCVVDTILLKNERRPSRPRFGPSPLYLILLPQGASDDQINLHAAYR
jgi:hypothetical protein